MAEVPLVVRQSQCPEGKPVAEGREPRYYRRNAGEPARLSKSQGNLKKLEDKIGKIDRWVVKQ